MEENEPIFWKAEKIDDNIVVQISSYYDNKELPSRDNSREAYKGIKYSVIY